MNSKEFFAELTKFAPQYTSLLIPVTIAMCSFLCISALGHKHNDKILKAKYNEFTSLGENEKISRYGILLIAALFFSFWVGDITYTIIDFQQNRKWYLWKLHWFPKLLS